MVQRPPTAEEMLGDSEQGVAMSMIESRAGIERTWSESMGRIGADLHRLVTDIAALTRPERVP